MSLVDAPTKDNPFVFKYLDHVLGIDIHRNGQSSYTVSSTISSQSTARPQTSLKDHELSFQANGSSFVTPRRDPGQLASKGA